MGKEMHIKATKLGKKMIGISIPYLERAGRKKFFS